MPEESFRVLGLRQDDGLTMISVLNQRGQEHTFPIFGPPDQLHVGDEVQFMGGAFKVKTDA